MLAVIAILFVIIGVVAGVIGSIAGLGGGIFFVPALLYFGNWYMPGSMNPQVAAATSLIVIAVTALSSSLSYFKQKKVDKESAMLFFIGSAPGAIVGVYLNTLLAVEGFSLLFGLFQLCMFVVLMVKDKIKPRSIKWEVQRHFVDNEGNEYVYGYSKWSVITIAFFVGITSSLFGVGGGILMVPAMMILFRFPPHIATATSMVVIFLSAVVGSITNIFHDNVHWLYAAMLAPGAWAGGKLGAIIASKMKGRTIVLFLRVLILGIAIQMIGEAIFG
ncbi:sulfite exporter TauE/SafE family protein [Brevibacillus sp. M2.1A]|uniref:sulfite exporter TauE/SafE family protein n=1 Tax=Brevibacillus TaxID=55080 RepID=UPI00156B6CE4|nr:MULTISPECIES: sulfite exporter TauE/SafE family protein [Brevibacillus]MBY0086160.1 sulfite exporter TauE/SafE family protein [Brevibacillus brevis]MCC8438145.1 sulfite exporter TauE/SafE family protein [Brevibacillus sp. M2.1A]MCE0450143.1 sulfite exporter TauE/SafE family protein [Brevibacillus sp. AF8]MCM3144300.1 sulfite exporter TauE/SafE family protein [Brevibacillus sp. MER 51]UKL00240.1 sulfite exporter TauE/SafE family protein [Brevibacillus brevis]